LREICPRKKRNPKSGANIGAITGILLKPIVDRLIDWLLLLLFECSNRNDVKQATAITDNNRVWLRADKKESFLCTVENYLAFVLKNLNYGFSLQKALTLDQA
jgi:hypothetical protein